MPLAVGAATSCATSPRDGFDTTDAAEPAAEAGVPPAVDAGFTPPATKDAATEPDAMKDAPAPVLAAILPTSAKVGALGPTLIVTGTDFVARSIVKVDGDDLSTTFVSATELRAPLPTTKLAAAGILQIVVSTYTPGGGVSAALPFDVENPAPAPTTLAPSSAPVGSPDTQLTVTGNDFAATGVKVTFGTTDLTVTASTPTSITATMPAALLLVSGSHAVKVVNPGPGGGTSTSIAFTVTNPSAVSITSVTPNVANAGDANTAVTIVGSGFVAGSTVQFNGTDVPSTTTDGAQIAATIPAAALKTAGDFSVVVTTPPPGGGVSAPSMFKVNNAAPTLATVSPNTGYYQGGDKTVTLSGTGYLASSVARLTGPGGTINLTTTYVSPVELTAVVPNTWLAPLGTMQIAVLTPAPGGGTSASQPFYVTCDPTGVQVALAAVGNVTSVPTAFAGQPAAARLIAGTCPATLSSSQQPQRSWVVQNTSSAPVILSAWAVCSASSTTPLRDDDAYLAFYRRSTPPATDAERKQCTGFVAEGATPTGNFASPESNGSRYCPGLTKANGGAMSLGVCEKAVVLTMPWSSTSTVFTAPPTVKITAEAP